MTDSGFALNAAAALAAPFPGLAAGPAAALCPPGEPLKIEALFVGRTTSSGYVDDVDFGVLITGISALRPPPPAATGPPDPRRRETVARGYLRILRDVVACSRPGRLPRPTDGPGTRTNTRLTRRRRGLGLGRSYSLSGLARETVHVYAEHAVVPLFSSQGGLGMFARAPGLTGLFLPPSVPCIPSPLIVGLG